MSIKICLEMSDLSPCSLPLHFIQSFDLLVMPKSSRTHILMGKTYRIYHDIGGKTARRKCDAGYTRFAMVPSSDYILPLRPVGYFCSYFEETSPGRAVIHMWPGRKEVLAKKLAHCQEPP